MESSLVSEFMNSTGCEIEDAYIFLRSNNWDIRSALDLWIERQNATSPENYNLTEAKKLSRGISRATTNINYVCEARSKLVFDKDNNPFLSMDGLYADSQGATFVLPDFIRYPTEFQVFLEKDLIDSATKNSLESSGRLNWWLNKLPQCMRLYPLSTTGDGNCLLHSVSLCMFGFHDRILFLRQLQHEFIRGSLVMQGLKRRWRYNVHSVNLRCGVVYTEQEWESEWQQIVELASTKRKLPNQQGTYESLEEIHILALAHMLRRVIIVISDTMLKDCNNQPFAPITIGGIYIPYECDSKTCNKNPLLISYDSSHFSSLVFMEKNESSSNSTEDLYEVPVVDANGQLLPLQFVIDPGQNFNWEDKNAFENLSLSQKEQINILREYLDIVDISEWESDEEIDQKPLDFGNLGENTDASSSTNKTAKQFQSIGKQFGSIGKSVGKKLRRNLGSLTRLASLKTKKAEDLSGKLLVALLHTKRLPYHEEMTKNYLDYAKDKFMREYLRQFTDFDEESFIMKQAIEEGLIKCNNAECKNVATVLTSYLCLKCYEKHIKEYNESQFGIGKSKFYRETDINCYRATQSIPVTQPASKCDKTLYLSNSTFYNDSGQDSNIKSSTVQQVEELASSLSQSLRDKIAICSSDSTPKNSDLAYKPYDGLKVKQVPIEIVRQPR